MPSFDPNRVLGHPDIVAFRSNQTGAQTDLEIVAGVAGKRIGVTTAGAFCDNANTVDVAVRVGFGDAATPTGAGVFLTHPGIAAGQGLIEGNASAVIGISGLGESIYLTNEVPTGGSIDVRLSYFFLEA